MTNSAELGIPGQKLRSGACGTCWTCRPHLIRDLGEAPAGGEAAATVAARGRLGQGPAVHRLRKVHARQRGQGAEGGAGAEAWVQTKDEGGRVGRVSGWW